jgi:hypothetical protein
LVLEGGERAREDRVRDRAYAIRTAVLEVVGFLFESFNGIATLATIFLMRLKAGVRGRVPGEEVGREGVEHERPGGMIVRRG